MKQDYHVLVVPTAVKGRIRYYVLQVKQIENFEHASWRNNFMTSGYPPLYTVTQFKYFKWNAVRMARKMHAQIKSRHPVTVLQYTAIVKNTAPGGRQAR